MDVKTVAKMTASSFIKEEREDNSTCYNTIRSEAKLKANQNNSCTRETLIKESYGFSLGRDFALDHNAEDCINRANNRISNTLCNMVMPCPNNGKSERNAVYRTNADNNVNEKRISSQKACSGKNGIRKERTNKIIIANVPCNQDWINLKSYENAVMFFNDSVREDDEVMIISATESSKQCISRTGNKFSRESEVNQCDDEIEILDTVYKNTDTRLNINFQDCVIVEERVDETEEIINFQDCVIVEEGVDETDDIICLGSSSKAVPEESMNNSLLGAQGSVTSICNELQQKFFNEISYNISKPKVDEACNTKKLFEFNENSPVDKRHEIRKTPVEEFDKTHKKVNTIMIKKEIPDDHLISIEDSTPNEKYTNAADKTQEFDKAHENFNTIIIKKEIPDDHLISIEDSTSNEEYTNATDKIQEFDKAHESVNTMIIKKEIPDDHLASIAESTSNEEYTNAIDGIQLKIESVYHLEEWEGEEVVFESNLNEPAENDNFQSENLIMPTIKKEKVDFVCPNNKKICEDKQDINSSEVNCISSNLVNTSALPKSTKPLENSSGDYTYVKKLSGLRPYKCSQCLFACKNKESLILHMQKCFRRRQRRERTRKKHEGKKKPMKCFLCSSQLENNFKLIQHLFRVHADTVNSNSVRSEIMSMIEISDVNGSSNNSRNKIIENAMRYKVGNSSNILEKVGNCSKMSDQIPNADVKELLFFRESSKNTQSSAESKCIFCGKSFYHNLDVRHVRKCIKRICSKEGYILVNNNKKTCEEQEAHNKEKILSETPQGGKFGCLICMKLFERLRCLYEHLFSHTPFKPYECPFCKKGFLKRILRSYHIQEKCKNRPHNMNISKPFKMDFSSLQLKKLYKENCEGLKNFPETNHDTKFNQGETLENHPVSAGERVNNHSVCCANYSPTTNDCSRCNDGEIDQPFQNNVAAFQENDIEDRNNCSTARQVDEDSFISFSNDDSIHKEKGEQVFCSVCSESFKHQIDFENHWSYAHEQLRCLYCRTIFKDRVNLKYHTRKCRVNSYSDDVNRNPDDNIEKNTRYIHTRKCRVNSYSDDVNRNPDNNVDESTNKIRKKKYKVRFNIPTEDTGSNINSSGSYNCSDCGRGFRSYYNLFSHRLVVHDGNEKITDKKHFWGKSSKPKSRHFVCVTCGKLFTNKVMLRFHVQDCLLSKKVKNRCRTKIRRETLYALRRNDKLYDFVGFTKPYTCLFCRMEFSDEFCFKLHKSKHCSNPGKPKGTYDLIVRLERIDDNVLSSEI